MQRSKSHLTLSIATAMLVLLAAGPPAQAQSLSGGLKVGLNVADMYGDDISAAEVRPLFSGGVFLTYRPSEILAIQPEVNFTMKGAEVSRSALGGDTPSSYEFGYLELPLLFKAYLPGSLAGRPNLFAGPALGIKLYGEDDGADLDDSVQPTEASMVFGGGLEIPFGRRSLILDLRYTLGLTDTFDNAGDLDARTGTFAASVGIRF